MKALSTLTERFSNCGFVCWFHAILSVCTVTTVILSAGILSAGQ